MFDLSPPWHRIPLVGTLPQKMLRSAQRVVQRSAAQQRSRHGVIVARLIDQLLTTGSFDAALSGLPGFTQRRPLQGRACLRHEAQLCGAILAPGAATFLCALRDAETFASHCLTPLLQARFGPLPAWRGTAGGVAMALPLGPGMHLALRVSDAPVDPLFIGQDLPGLSLEMSVHLSD